MKILPTFCGTGSTRTHPEVSKFNSAHQEDSIEGCNITVALVEPMIVKFTPKKGIFYAFFRIYGTGSDWDDRKWVDSNPGGHKLSIEVQFVTVA